MFSFRSDKVGFFVTIILLVLLAGAVGGTIWVLVLGDWEAHKWILKWVWGVWWVLCIITVLVRLNIFRWQMNRAQRQAPGEETTPPAPPEGSGPGAEAPQRQDRESSNS